MSAPTIHDYRIFGLAIVDLAATLGASFLIAKYTRYRETLWTPLGVAGVFFGLWALGTVLHIAFRVQSPIANWIVSGGGGG